LFRSDVVMRQTGLEIKLPRRKGPPIPPSSACRAVPASEKS
jgi:hypothetical protein